MASTTTPTTAATTAAAAAAAAAASSAGAQVDPAQMNTFRSYVTMLGDAGAKDEIKMKAAQELSENFELITQGSGFQLFLEHSMKIFIKILHDGEPLFISEYNLQQVSGPGQKFTITTNTKFTDNVRNAHGIYLCRSKFSHKLSHCLLFSFTSRINTRFESLSSK